MHVQSISVLGTTSEVELTKLIALQTELLNRFSRDEMPAAEECSAYMQRMVAAIDEAARELRKARKNSRLTIVAVAS